MAILLPIVFVGLTASAVACAQQGEPAVEPAPPLVTVETLTAKPEEYAGRLVRVRGRLENAGTNYFRDRRIVLTDGKNHTVNVKPWLPLSVPPSAQSETRPTLAAYLDRQVELSGSLTKSQDAQGANQYIFQVTSAKVLTSKGRP